MEEELEETPIPKSEHIKRINSKNNRIAELEEQLKAVNTRASDLEKQVNGFEPEKFERRIGRLTEERDNAIQLLSDFRATTSTREALLTAGITDADDQDLIRWRYDRMDEKGRPELGAWLADGARADRQLQHLWNGADTATETAPQAAEATTAPVSALPAVNNGVRPPSQPPAAMTREAIQAMSYKDRAKPENRSRIAEALKAP